MMQIFIKTLNNRTIVLDIEPYFSVELLKDKIEDKEGIPSNKQRLVMGGKTLINGKKLYDYNIQNNNTIHVMISLLGGRILNHQLAKYQELSKLVREHSTDKKIGPVSKAGKKAFEEAKKSYPADFMAQVDEAKRLFKANPNKYIT